MAKKAVITTKELSKDELISHLVEYWISQPEDLDIHSGKEFDCSTIREGLKKQKITDVSNEEIFLAQNIILRRAVLTCDLIQDLEIKWAKMEDQSIFIITFKIVILKTKKIASSSWVGLEL